MDAHALLVSQGWRGTGHSLHKTDDTIGLAKPIMLSKKVGNKGIGKVQHFTSNQWWLNAFDEQLKGLDTSKEGKVVQNVTTGKLNTFEKGALAKYSVYSTFVRGGFLEGTLSDTDSMDLTDATTSATTTGANTPREPGVKETKEEKRARKEAKRQRKEERSRIRAARSERREKKAAANADKVERRRRKEEKRRIRKLEKDQAKSETKK